MCNALVVQPEANLQRANHNVDSIVVAGGKASRISGIDKTMLPLGVNGNALLVDVIKALPGKVVVVGKPRSEVSDVTWVSDLVENGGPAAGIWAGLVKVKSEYVFITAGDQRITGAQVDQIISAATSSDGAWAIREDGSGQPLFACVKTELLKDLLAPTQGVNASPLRLMQNLDMVGVNIGNGQVLDIDTWADVVKVVKETGMSEATPIWLKQVAAILEIPEAQIPVNELLDLTREVAHNVERKSAPLTTFLIGLAAGQTNVDPHDLIAKINQAINDWTPSE